MHPRLAASQAAARQPSASTAGAARAAPFAAPWPYQTFLELGALADAVPSARLHARLVLGEWGLAAISDETELLVSELVTNGVRASRAVGQDMVRMWLVRPAPGRGLRLGRQPAAPGAGR